jgi:surfactin synthase thioesterase subunit
MFPARQDNDEQLLDWMSTNGLMPGYALRDAELREMALELMRADIRVRDTFRYLDGARVSVPLQVLTGDRDGVIASDTAEQWQALALVSCRHDRLPGGHFYTPEIWRRLPSFITSVNKSGAGKADIL